MQLCGDVFVSASNYELWEGTWKFKQVEKPQEALNVQNSTLKEIGNQILESCENHEEEIYKYMRKASLNPLGKIACF